MSLWQQLKRREHPRGFLPQLEKALGLALGRRSPPRRARAAPGKSQRRTR